MLVGGFDLRTEAFLDDPVLEEGVEAEGVEEFEEKSVFKG
ncbi:MAG: hypothetical protein RLZZ158_64 [Cyanobacteriota bacterium]|jgi:hypothetical protein